MTESRSELRRRAAALAIERAAVELALELGSEQVTVELICEQALISHRTFYNYFPSRDAAIVGDGPPSPSESASAVFLEGRANVVGDLVELLASSVLESQGEDEIFTLRRTLMDREPALLEKRMANFGAFIDTLTSLVLSRFERQGRTPDTSPDLREEAEIVVALAGAVMQHSMHAHIRSGVPAPEILARSVVIARRVLAEGTP